MANPNQEEDNRRLRQLVKELRSESLELNAEVDRLNQRLAEVVSQRDLALQHRKQAEIERDAAELKVRQKTKVKQEDVQALEQNSQISSSARRGGISAVPSRRSSARPVSALSSKRNPTAPKNEVIEIDDSDDEHPRPASSNRTRHIGVSSVAAKATVLSPRSSPSDDEGAPPNLQPVRPLVALTPKRKGAAPIGADAAARSSTGPLNARSLNPVRPAAESSPSVSEVKEEPLSGDEDVKVDASTSSGSNSVAQTRERVNAADVKPNVKKGEDISLTEASLIGRYREADAENLDCQVPVHLLGYSHTREFQSACFGGGPQPMNSVISDEKRRELKHKVEGFFCINFFCNPLAPRRIGERGLLFTRKETNKWPAEMNLVVCFERNDWRYLGTYTWCQVTSVTKEEWAEQSDEVKNTWITTFETAVWAARIRVRIALRQREGHEPSCYEVATADKSVAENVSRADIKAALDSGEERLNVYCLKPTRYDLELAEEIYKRNEEWKGKKSRGQVTGSKRKSKGQLQSSVAKKQREPSTVENSPDPDEEEVYYTRKRPLRLVPASTSDSELEGPGTDDSYDTS